MTRDDIGMANTARSVSFITSNKEKAFSVIRVALFIICSIFSQLINFALDFVKSTNKSP